MRREAPRRTTRRLPGLRPRGAAWPVMLLLGAAGLIAAAAPAAAQTLLTQEEALGLAFPSSRVERHTAYLAEAELDRARRRAGSDVPIEQGIITYYVGHRDGRPTGVAYFDVHRVRTMEEVVMVVVSPDHRVRRIDVLKFTEPPEYRAPEGWVAQLEGRALDEELALTGAIRNLTGATLTARALTRAARRILALHAVIDPLGRAR